MRPRAEFDPGEHGAACDIGWRRQPSADDSDGIDKANSRGDFSMQISAESYASVSTGIPASTELISRQCTEADVLAQQVLEEEALKEAVSSACAECSFCVTVADPRSPDFPLVAVSRGFEAMTGFRSEEILGVNCRFLNSGCYLDPATLAALREACRTGQPFTAVITNRKKSGQLFLNLLDLRGLIVGRTHTGEDLWFLVGIQADVSHVPEAEVPDGHLPQLRQVAANIRARIASVLPAAGPPVCAGAEEHDGRTARAEGPHDLRWREGPCLGQPLRPGGDGSPPSAAAGSASGKDEAARAALQGILALSSGPRGPRLAGGLALLLSALAAAALLPRLLRRPAARAC